MRQTPGLVLTLTFGLLVACSDDSGSDKNADTGAESNCRSVLAGADVALNFDAPAAATLVGTLDQESLTHEVVISAVEDNSEIFTAVYTYKSLEDLVTEAKVLGRRTMMVEDIKENFKYAYSYNVDGTLAGWDKNEGEETQTYTTWDDQGRPTAGTWTISGHDCSDAPVTVTYDEAARTATTVRKMSEGSGAECPSKDLTVVQTYDDNNYVIKHEEEYEQPMRTVVEYRNIQTTPFCLE